MRLADGNESCRAEKKHPHFPIKLAYRKCKYLTEKKEKLSALPVYKNAILKSEISVRSVFWFKFDTIIHKS